MKRKKLQASDLDKIHLALTKEKVPTLRDEKGEPCYMLYFNGTKKEYQALKRKLKE